MDVVLKKMTRYRYTTEQDVKQPNSTYAPLHMGSQSYTLQHTYLQKYI